MPEVVLYAEDDYPADSVFKQFPTVDVEAEKYELKNEKLFSAFSVIKHSEIEDNNPRQISEMLNKEPGIFMKDYGGLGGIKTISLRGTSSQQTLVMIEGMKFNNVQSNSLDFSVIPVAFLESVDILRGGSSAVFGSSSVGGTINFNLQTGKEKTSLKATAGSFGEYSASISSSFDIEAISLNLAADYINSKGDYPFTVNQFGKDIEYTRENADFENLNLLFGGQLNSTYWSTKFIAMGRLSERGAPGPVLLGYIEPDDARLRENEADIIIKTEKHIGDDIFSAGLLYRYNYQDYFDSNSPNALRGDTVSIFKTNDIQLKMQYTEQYKYVELNYGIDGEFTGLRGDFLQPEVGEFVSRFQAGLFARAVFTTINNNEINLPVQIAARYDYYTDVTNSPTGLAGVSLFLKKINLALKTQFSYNYRAPSFNEMYYLNYGTIDLKPERSASFNLTVSYAPSPFNFEINGFVINTKDQIIAVPKTPLSWSAQNMASVLSRGIEFVFNTALFNDILRFATSYTLQSVTDNNKNSDTYSQQVVYVPQEMLTAKISASIDGFYTGFNIHYTGFTYFLPENIYTSVIPSYWLLNFNFSKKFSINNSAIIFKFDILNLLNEEYTVIKNYPMPGRIFRLGLEYRLL